MGSIRIPINNEDEMKKEKEGPFADVEFADNEEVVEAWPGATDAMVECPRCTSYVVGRKTDDYYYWMFQCCLLVIIAGVGAWLHTQWHWSSMQGLIVDVGFPVAWTWLAIFLFDVFR